METEPKIDESQYSRQLIMIGEQAMKRMVVSSVLISGLGGLGVEIAKNIALAGVRTLTLNDTKATSWLDLSTNFYTGPKDIGVNRADVCIKQISELNPNVKYAVTHEDLGKVDLSFFDQFKCVIVTDAPLSVQLRVNDYCHEKGIRFIATDVRGVFAWSFCDFGSEFEVFDKNGEESREVLVGKITKANPGVVTCLNDEKHGFEDDDTITFREVQGMTQINGTQHKIKVLSPSSFSIGDTSSFSDYSREGIVAQVKVPVKFAFHPLRAQLADPTIVFTDFAKLDSPIQTHIAMQALHAFSDKHNGQLPAPWNAKDAEEVIEIAKHINETQMKNKVDKVDDKLLRQVSYTSQGAIVALTSFAGGVVAQECIKALSGKYSPLQQWMYFDGVEVLPSLDTDPSNFQPSGSRADGQIICLGKDLCQKLSNSKLFMIGCGAIGCEMIKNFAMLDVGSGPNGSITITDNDLIEKSNLNRQFLFRSKDLQHPKSETAANAVRAMNPNLKVIAYQDKVGPDSETKYNDQFFEGLDFVVNALDNVNARLYVDSRCVVNKRPLLESGTLGPKGHVQVILPFKTESYGSQRDPPEKDVPFCTLKSFPNLIEHCIEWARDFSFGGLFVSKPMQWNQLHDEDNLVERLRQPYAGGIDLKVVRTSAKLLKNRPHTFDDCVVFARKKYEAYYVHKPLQLLHSFPLDHKVDDKGTLFWTSPKRPPKAIPFDWNDASHKNFILAMANLWAFVWGIKSSTNEDHIRKVVESIQLPPFVPKHKKIETDESKKAEDVKKENTPQSADEEIETITKELAAFFSDAKSTKFKLNAIDFEKDDDTNFHIDFITATANLRARAYAIPEVERLKVKTIAGRIMPAIATTTAAVAGCVSLELVKVVRGDLPLDAFKNLFMNLALPFWSFTEPGAAEKKKIVGNATYTLWDRWDVKEGDITLGELLDHFQKHHNLTVGGVFKGANMIYVPMFPAHAKRKPQKMSALLKRKPGQAYEDLILTFSDSTTEDISGPPVRFYFEK